MLGGSKRNPQKGEPHHQPRNARPGAPPSPGRPEREKREGNGALRRHATAHAPHTHARCGTHSLRIGGASTLAMLGVEDHIIQTLGRWTSLCYQRYTRMGPRQHAEVSRLMANPDNWKHKGPFGGLTLDQTIGVEWGEIGIAFRSSRPK